MALKLCWIDEEDAKVLGAIVRALRDSHKHLGKLAIQHLSLTMGDGSVRTVKLLVATADDSAAAGQGGGGAGLPEGYTFEEFTICVDGAPETRWWATWTSDPEA